MCFDNLIGINTECAPSTSGYNLTDIGITLDHLNDIVGREYADGQELAESRLAFATKVVSNLVLQNFGNRFITSTLVDGQRIAQAEDNNRIVTGAAQYIGVELELCNTSSFLDLNINSVDLVVESSGDIDLQVFDLKQGRVIDTITVTAVAGEVVNLPLEKIYPSNKKHVHLFIGYDSTGIDAPEYSIYGGGCLSCNKGGTNINKWMRVRGGKLGLAASPIKSNVTGETFTGGLSINYSLTCNHELWLCQMKNLLALPVLYKTGSLITQYAIETRRENPETMEDWKDRQDFMELSFRESLDNVINNIKLPTDITCFSCAKPVRHVAHSI